MEEDFAYLHVSERANESPAPVLPSPGATLTLPAVLTGEHELLPYDVTPLVVPRDERLILAPLVVVVRLLRRGGHLLLGSGVVARVKGARHNDEMGMTELVVTAWWRCASVRLLDRTVQNVTITLEESDVEPRLPSLVSRYDTALLPFQLDLFDTAALRRRVLDLLEDSVCFAHVCAKVKCVADPDEFSYAVGSRICVSGGDREAFSALRGTSTRLRFLVSFLARLQGRQTIVCAECDEELSSLRFVFSLSKQDFHVNQHGAIHGLLTVKEAQMGNMQLLGHPSAEHSYFRK